MDGYIPENTAYGAFTAVGAYAAGPDADQPQQAAGIDVIQFSSGLMVRQAEPMLLHQLDSTASVILELCDGRHTVAEIADEVADVFSLEALPLATVVECVAGLRRAGILADRAHSRMRPPEADQGDNPFNFFEGIYCLNLDGRPDRWAASLRRFRRLKIAARVERFAAIPTPDNHHVGCARSWRVMIATARRRRLRNFLGFEDDAIFLDDTVEILRRGLAELDGLPWDLLYLGGAAWESPLEIPGHVVLQSPRSMTCLQAVAINHTAYDRLLADIPEADGIREWITTWAAIDQYLPHQVREGNLRAYVLNPRVATQIEHTNPGALDAALRDRYTIR
jgi:hypothetical protein